MRTPFVIAVGLMAAMEPASATLQDLGACQGARACVLTRDPPNPVVQNPDDGILLAWDECQNVRLEVPLRVDRVFDETADFITADGDGFSIRPGTIVSSHYLQWDPGNGSAPSVETVISADAQIFALITADEKLFASDGIVGLPGVDYNDFAFRGLEPHDTAVFRGTDIEIRWRASSPGDWVRLITAYSPAAAVGGGLGAADDIDDPAGSCP